MEVASQADVLCFAETGVGYASHIPGFKCIHHGIRIRAPHCGGVACYLREHLVLTYQPHCILVDAEKGVVAIALHPPGHKAICITVCYLPHVSSKILGTGVRAKRESVNAFFQVLHEVCKKSAGMDMVIVGDFNAHTGQLNEMDRPGVADLQDASGNIVMPYAALMHAIGIRTSKDISPPNSHGTALLDFCAEAQVTIMNGRLQGDVEGEITYMGNFGSCTIDYVIASPGLCFEERLTLHNGHLKCKQRPGVELKVVVDALGKPVPGTDCGFDHAPLVLTVGMAPLPMPELPRIVQEPKLRWRDDKRDAYVGALCNDHRVGQLLDECREAEGVLEAGRKLCQAVQLAAETAAMKSSGAKGRGVRKQAWFDAECARLRQAKINANRVHGVGHPTAKQVAKVYWAHIKQVKGLYMEEILRKRIDDWRVCPRKFWQDFKAEQGPVVHLGIAHWTEHFRRVLGTAPAMHLREGSVEAHCQVHGDMFMEASPEAVQQASSLNGDITQGEVDVALKFMANGKAAGEDGISAEFFTHDIPANFANAGHALLPYITRVFNLAFTKGEYPESWATCTITPVPKAKGNPSDPDSYRGIAVSTALSKLFSIVLMKRLDAWAEQHGRRAKGQAGFRRGRSTTDNVFVLQHCIERCKGRAVPLYAAFIDFQKAYDCVNRSLLWQALKGMGVHGNMMSILQAMYSAGRIVHLCFWGKTRGPFVPATFWSVH